MQQATNKAAQTTTFDEIFDCGTMKSLIDDKGKLNFTERFSSWIANYTRDANEKIWRDIEYLRAEG